MSGSKVPAAPSGSGQTPQGDSSASSRPPSHSPDFPAIGWEPEAKALAALADFMASDWHSVVQLAAPPAENATEANALLARMPERLARLNEIIAHNTDASAEWTALIGPIRAYPRVWAALVAARMIARTLAMYHKRKHGRARPQQVVPSLAPPVAMPSTPSYPSVNAAEAYLMATTLGHIAPALATAAATLAARIADGREVAGLNYPSDTTAGQTLASSTWSALQNANGFSQMLTAAKAEWGHKSANPWGLGGDEDGGDGGW